MAGACVALLAGCGSAAPASTTPTFFSSPATAAPTPTATPTPVPTPAGPGEADLAAVERELYPPSPDGGDCLSIGTGSGSTTACPVTARLAALLSAALVHPESADDPICGCQAIDAHQVVAYSPGQPPGEGTIRVTAFGTPQVDYVVIPSGGQFLVDDVIYCTPTPHSIYSNESVHVC